MGAERRLTWVISRRAQVRFLTLTLSLTAKLKVSQERARRAVQNEGEQKCVVCLESARDVVFMPCFHVVSCWNCGLRVSECPVCRVAIQQKRRVYS